MRENKIGKLGEKEVSKWITQADGTANKSDEDENGWDFIAEFPPDFAPNGISFPLDKADSPLKCWIQVKSTDYQRGNYSVTLKNWLRLAYTDYPAFFLVCEFDGKEEVQRAFLVHIGEEYIGQVQQRLRELGAVNRDKLHKKVLRFTYDSPNCLKTLNGAGLLSAIKQYVRATDKYIEWKRKIRNEIGYEEHGYIINTTVTIPAGIDPLDYFIDFSLGLIPSLETVHTEFKDVRFGIEAAELTKVYNEGGKLELPTNLPVEKGIVIFRLEDFSQEVQIDTDIYAPKGIQFKLDKKYWKLRFSAQFVEMVFSLESRKAEFNFPPPPIDKQFRLIQLHKFSQIILLIYESQRRNINVIGEIWVEDQNVTGIISRFQLPKDVVEKAQKIRQAWIIAKFFDIQDQVELSIIELLQQKFLGVISAILNHQKPKFRVTYWLDKQLSHSSTEIFSPHVIPVALGDYMMFVAIAIVGYPERTENSNSNGIEWSLYSDTVTPCGNRIINRQERSKFESIIKELYKATIKDGKGHRLLMWTEEAKELIGASELQQKELETLDLTKQADEKGM